MIGGAVLRMGPVMAVAALLPLPALADPALECAQAGSQVEVSACLEEAEARVDTAIGTALSLAMTAATELDEVTGRVEAETPLDASQMAWDNYRDTHCTYVGSTYGGGSGTGIAIRSCRITLGRARIAELMAHLP